MSWRGAVGLSLKSRVCPAADSTNKILHAGRCAGRTAQWAEHAVPRACLNQPASVTSHNRCAQILSSSPFAVSPPAPSTVLSWDLNATPDTHTRAPVVQLSCRSRADHRGRRPSVSAAWGNGVATQPSTRWRRHAGPTSGRWRRARRVTWTSWRVPPARRSCDGHWRVSENWTD